MERKLGDIRRVRDHFAKFVPEAVKRLVAANPEAPELDKRERDVSVLFLDISGYAGLSERLLKLLRHVVVAAPRWQRTSFSTPGDMELAGLALALALEGSGVILCL